MRFSALLLVGLLALGFHNGQAASAAMASNRFSTAARLSEGWQGPDMSFWSVEDGAITGTISPEHSRT